MKSKILFGLVIVIILAFNIDYIKAAENLNPEGRVKLANLLEEGMLKNMYDFQVAAIGKDKTTLKITAAEINRPFVYNFINIKGEDLKNNGFKKVLMSNGYQTWTYNLISPS